MTHNSHDTPDVRIFECLDCGQRVNTDRQPLHCRACGGDLRDLSVPREP